MKPTAYVHLGYGFAADNYRIRFEQGLVPDPVPYGFHHAVKSGWNVLYSTDHDESRFSRLLRRSLNSLLGFDLLHAWRNRRSMRDADIIWTMEERQGLAIILLGFFLQMPPVILQVIWLFDRWRTFTPLHRFVFTKLLRRASRVTVHSREYLARAQRLNLQPAPLLLRFGISTESFAFHPQAHLPHDPIHVLAMGSDPTRDWKTFLDAFGSDNRFTVVAISPHLTSSLTSSLTNVTVPTRPAMKDFAAFYEWADVVVIPMVPNLYSGITVALEATRSGVTVVSSRTGGVPTYLAADEAVYVEPENPSALRTAVLTCDYATQRSIVAKAQRRFAMEDYTTSGMALRYIQLSQEVLAEAGNAIS